ncbi:MAG: hypothetical protein PHN98_09960 [Smithellaceae bacterium]|nr:hypothetical protein [Smithellaceae bacterium]
MTEWLRPLSLQKRFGVALTESLNMESSLPDWVGFLIWAGWWMNKRSSENERAVLVLLLPTRICCPAFCCLGALLRSIEKKATILSWNQFVELPAGSKVCLRYPDPRSRLRKIAVEGIICEEGSKAERKIKILSKNKRFNELIQSVLQARFDDYEITTVPPPSCQLDKKLSNIIMFYKSIMKDFKAASVFSWSRECLLVTRLAGWKNEVENVNVSVQGASEKHYSYGLQDLLMPSHDLNAEYSGTFLSTPKADILNYINSPLAILNGPEAIKSWDRIKSSNVIMLLDHLEYDETIENFLALLSDARSNRIVDLPEGIPENPPSGVEMVLFDLG